MGDLGPGVAGVLGLPEEDVVEREHDGGERHAEHVHDDGEHAHALLVALAIVQRVQHQLVTARALARPPRHRAAHPAPN